MPPTLCLSLDHVLAPDFKPKIIETLAKRAAYCCSNPDCKASTVGPNFDKERSTLIGEAAHIFGARPNSARYATEMTDTARAEITNGIWLCRNCHKLIDHDTENFPAELLFFWREEHEEWVASRIGKKSDRFMELKTIREADEFDEYGPIVRRIIIDKPEGWEFRLTAELLRTLNQKCFRQLDDLRNGRYFRALIHLKDDDVINWVKVKNQEISNLATAITSIIDSLNNSWGNPGKSGDAEEILHHCKLVNKFLIQSIEFEESVRFILTDHEFEDLVTLFRDSIGSQADKLSAIPDDLDQMLDSALEMAEQKPDTPIVMKKTISFDLPVGWGESVGRELRKIEKHLHN